MSLQKLFVKFDDAIHITRENSIYSRARLKDKSILDSIKDAFEKEGYPIIENFIQGSFATHTAIKEAGVDFDIDRAIVIDADKAPADALKPKKVVLEILEKRQFKNATIKKPCVTADYQTENLHIDIPIYKKDSNNRYYLALGKSVVTAEWIESDPRGLIDWVNDNPFFYHKDKALEQFKRLVRYMKKWRNMQFSDSIKEKIFSIGLTVMIKEQFQPSINTEGFANDVESLKNTLKRILQSGCYFTYQGNDQYKIRVNLPVLPHRDIYNSKGCAKRGTQLRRSIVNLIDKLAEVSDSSLTLYKKSEIMAQQFGPLFPVVAVGNEAFAEKVELFENNHSSAGIVGTSQGA